MLGLDNPIHIAFVLILLLLVFGAKRLPEMGKSLGEGLRGFKESISGESPTAGLTQAHAAVHVDEVTVPVAQPVVAPAAQPVVAPAAQPVADRSSMRPVA